MLQLMISLGVMNLLAAMSPGPDFAIVTRNCLLGGRRFGILTALGISCALLIHITYCTFGLALIIRHSSLAFNSIKIIGGLYLIYLGYKTITQEKSLENRKKTINITQEKSLSATKAFISGFLTNALNPKAIIFLLAMFTMVLAHPLTPLQRVIIAIELFIVVFSWFSVLSILLNHPYIKDKFLNYQAQIMRILGVFLILFGIALFFVKAQ
jgi:RhtB (resistance to homoserine/threonine) family protein